MLFRGKTILNKILIALLIAAILVCASYFVYTHILNLQEKEEINLKRTEFLNLVEKGDLSASSSLWPSVYTHGKDNTEFLL